MRNDSLSLIYQKKNKTLSQVYFHPHMYPRVCLSTWPRLFIIISCTANCLWTSICLLSSVVIIEAWSQSRPAARHPGASCNISWKK